MRATPQPVYEGYFADPFAWRHQDAYYAIGTGGAEAEGHPSGRVFPLLHSPDFRHWEPAGTAMARTDPRLGTHFWAPEVTFADGTFYLYYSVGRGDKNHQLRVAASSTALGPYEDLGVTLLDPGQCAFAIDPHLFRDDDGRSYLFYATDFLDHTEQVRPGTALMVAPLATMTRLDDAGRVVLRARSDWQRFQAERPMYGRVFDWHTLEGPSVCKRGGKYYCFYSGGRWENETYGVDYGVADHVLGPYHDAGNEAGPRVLHTLPGQLIGPGHNSIVTGPDGEDYLVYHAWDPSMTARRMFVDPLVWTREGPRCRRWVELDAERRQ